jgi:hypothetical protein
LSYHRACRGVVPLKLRRLSTRSSPKGQSCQEKPNRLSIPRATSSFFRLAPNHKTMSSPAASVAPLRFGTGPIYPRRRSSGDNPTAPGARLRRNTPNRRVTTRSAGRESADLTGAMDQDPTSATFDAAAYDAERLALDAQAMEVMVGGGCTAVESSCDP